MTTRSASRETTRHREASEGMLVGPEWLATHLTDDDLRVVEVDAKVRILDCSRDTWRAEGHPWSDVAPDQVGGGHHLGNEDERVRADRGAVQDAIGRPGTSLVDVRSTA